MGPSVSVLIPVHDGEAHLSATLASALAQSHRDIEVVVLDDGSSDGSHRIVAAFAEDPRVRPFHRERPEGAASAWNLLLSTATGEYVVLLPQDDLLAPTAIATRLGAIHGAPGVIGSLSRYRLIDAQGRRLGPTMGSRTLRGPIDAERLLRTCARSGGNSAGPPGTLMARREDAVAVGYRADAGYAIDLAHLLGLAGRGPLLGLRDCDSSFRVHAGAWTRRLQRTQTADFLRALEGAVDRRAGSAPLPAGYRRRAATRTLIRRIAYDRAERRTRTRVTAPG